jgi:hypothetical protein
VNPGMTGKHGYITLLTLYYTIHTISPRIRSSSNVPPVVADVQMHLQTQIHVA